MQDAVKASMICACSAFLAVYLRGPGSAPLETGFSEAAFSVMHVLDFVEQKARVPPRSTMTTLLHTYKQVQLMTCDDEEVWLSWDCR